MLDAPRDVGDDFRELRLSVGTIAPSANTRTGPLYLRMRSTRPARWYSAPKAVLKNPSTISLSVKVFFSARWRAATPEFADGGPHGSARAERRRDQSGGDKPERDS